MGETAWQPIETAPKDGTRVLTSAGLGFPVWDAAYTATRPPGEPQYRWEEYGPRWQRTGFCDVGYRPKYWMPIPDCNVFLPAPPK